MNPRILLSLAFALSSFATVLAQQLPLFTQYRDLSGIINPASVSSDFILNGTPTTVGATYRRQYVGQSSSSPTTQVLYGEHIFNGSGSAFSLLTGGYLMNDQTGPTGFTGFYGRIAGLLTEDPEYSGFSAGLNIGVVQYRVNASDFRPRDRDDILTLTNQKKTFPDVGVGVEFYRKLSSGGSADDVFRVGASVPQVIGLNLDFKTDKGTYFIKRIQHVYAHASFIHFTEEDGRYLEPSAWLKYAPNTPISVDFNLKFQVNPSFWLAAGGSTGGMIHAETGVALGDDAGLDGRLSIGYGFDYSFTTFGPTAGSSHEFGIKYSFGK
jgi:type IX secretion system PorP/SprF family membrane protein